MVLIKNWPKKNRFLTSLSLQNRFYAHKGCPYIDGHDRFMRRYETGFRFTGRHWIFTEEEEYLHR